MDNRNTIIAIVASLVILLGWQYLFPSDSLLTPPAATPSAQTAPATPGAAPSADIPPVAAPATATPDAVPAAPSAPEKRIPIMTKHLRGSISLTGGRFDDITLTDYRETLDPQSPAIVLLAPASDLKHAYAEWGWISGDSSVALPNAATVWTAANPDAALSEASPLVLTWDNGQGLVFTRTIRADREYLFTVEQTIQNNSERPVTLYPYSLAARFHTTGNSGLGMAYTGPIGVLNGTLKEVSYDDVKKKGRQTEESVGAWIGFSDQYWLSTVAFDPALKVSASFNYANTGGRDRFQTDLRADPVVAQPGESKSVKGYVFAGAKELQLLDEYAIDPGLPRFDLAIDFGWYYFLTKPFFLALRWLHGLFGNFGLAIIGLATLVRLAMFPIANRQYKMMNNMRRVQPEMQRIQERHAKDPTKRNQELMELYKREKVNPLGGCLPILIQIPVFYALYKVLSVTIEMRHAPFYGWIHDLSVADPTSVLNIFGLLPYGIPSFLSFVSIGAWPLIMGVTMWVQQKLSPAPTDPMQARIMMLMPIIITFVLAPYAAGLVIYWAWSNILGILQQWLLLKRSEAAAPKPAA
jgi:YidC/Oxa1 family membrane protein insertase